MTENLASTYQALYTEVLVQTADNLRRHLAACLEEIDRVDAVVARAKSPERFAAKALKQIDGQMKYQNPLVQIHDQIGARVTVLYLTDVEPVKNAIDNYFHAIEWLEKKPEKDAEFGYFGDHYTLAIPDDVVPEGEEQRAPKFFELQIKTLFQHAWSEATHDIGYKAPRELTSHERRQMAFLAAQAWGADQLFVALANDVVANNDID